MTKPSFDQDHWDRLWSTTLRDHADKVAMRAPNAHLLAEAASLSPGRALDAGCGHGAETLWLSARGWRVDAVDFSPAVLAHGRSLAAELGDEMADRIDWIEGDLTQWMPRAGHYDLVVCLYVHAADSVDALVRRMAVGVAPGGTLLLVGHRPVDPATGTATAAANQSQVSVEAALAAIDPDAWEILVAEDRARSGRQRHGRGDPRAPARRRHALIRGGCAGADQCVAGL